MIARFLINSQLVVDAVADGAVFNLFFEVFACFTLPGFL